MWCNHRGVTKGWLSRRLLVPARVLLVHVLFWSRTFVLSLGRVQILKANVTLLCTSTQSKPDLKGGDDELSTGPEVHLQNQRRKTPQTQSPSLLQSWRCYLLRPIQMEIKRVMSLWISSLRGFAVNESHAHHKPKHTHSRLTEVKTTSWGSWELQPPLLRPQELRRPPCVEENQLLPDPLNLKSNSFELLLPFFHLKPVWPSSDLWRQQGNFNEKQCCSLDFRSL